MYVKVTIEIQYRNTLLTFVVTLWSWHADGGGVDKNSAAARDMLDEMWGHYYILDSDNDDDDGHLDGADVYDNDVWGWHRVIITLYLSFSLDCISNQSLAHWVVK